MKSNRFSAAFRVGGGVIVGVGVIVIVGDGVIGGVTVGVGVGVLLLVTVVVAVAVLFAKTGSSVCPKTATLVVMTVPFTTLLLTLTVNVINTDPLINNGLVQFIAPVAPTAGVVQVKPNLAVGDNDTKVVFAGTAVNNVTLLAAFGPLLVRKIE